MTGNINRGTVKSYLPDSSIVRLFTLLLQYKSDVEDRQIVNKSRKRYLDKEKVQILDKYIFQSMANLTFFFKSISRYPQLKEIFDDDIKDLLGIRRLNPQQEKYGFIFSELLRSILLIEEEAPSEEVADEKDFPLYYQLAEADKEDFRLQLNQILQDIIGIKVVEIDLTDYEFEQEKHIIEDDFNRVRLWTKIIAKGVTQAAEYNERPHRTIKFGNTPLREDEDPI